MPRDRSLCWRRVAIAWCQAFAVELDHFVHHFATFSRTMEAHTCQAFAVGLDCSLVTRKQRGCNAL